MYCHVMNCTLQLYEADTPIIGWSLCRHGNVSRWKVQEDSRRDRSTERSVGYAIYCCCCCCSVDVALLLYSLFFKFTKWTRFQVCNFDGYFDIISNDIWQDCHQFQFYRQKNCTHRPVSSPNNQIFWMDATVLHHLLRLARNLTALLLNSWV